MPHDDNAAENYARAFPDYQAYTAKLRILLEDLVQSRSIQFQVIEGRAKTIESFREKINRPGKSYENPLEELPDLSGCRVITYYLEDVGNVCELINSEFEVVEEELSHQPAALQADQFGYLSAHYVVRLNKERAKLPEWASFKHLRSEIQVRTVIQHAWSAVSHALQYKTETEGPSLLSRRLYRIAGLFELADEEFGAIRQQRIALRRSASEAIASGQIGIPLSIASISEFISSWVQASDLIDKAKESGFDIEEPDDEDDSLSNIYDLAVRIGLKTLADLEETLKAENFKKLGLIYGGQRQKTSWAASIEFLVFLLLLIDRPDFATVDYLVERGWSKPIARDVVDAVRQNAS